MALSPGFWTRVVSLEPDDSIEVFDRAAELRYYDAQELLGEPGRLAGAVYLLGYCVELVLKAAYCRIVGVGPADPMWVALDGLGTPAPTVRHHRIADLYRMVSTERVSRGFAVNPIFEGELQRVSLLAASHWKEELRYRSVGASQAEADEVDEAATWMLLHRHDIWK